MVAQQGAKMSSKVSQESIQRSERIIGRDTEIALINKVIDADGTTEALFIVADGGLGKTRLLEEVGVLFKERAEKHTGKKPFLWSGIIDLYHVHFHVPVGVQNGITLGLQESADQLDLKIKCFPKFRKKYDEFKEIIEAGSHRQRVLVGELEEIFFNEYRALSNKYRLVLCFDTLENLEFESSALRELCEVDRVGLEIRHWLLEKTPTLLNTGLLFAARRSKPVILEQFTDAFGKIQHDLQSLSSQDAEEYIDLAIDRHQLERKPDRLYQQQMINAGNGNPVRLALLFDTLRSGHPLSESSIKRLKEDAKKRDLKSAEVLFEEIIFNLLPSPIVDVISFMLVARMGVTRALLAFFISQEEHLEIEDLNALFEQAKGFEITKTLEDERLFLHDEMYDLYDRLEKSSSKGRLDSFRLIESILIPFYAELIKNAKTVEEQEEAKLAMTYYQLQQNAYVGYWVYYARWDEQAVKAHNVRFSLRLREVVLRFLNRYTQDSNGEKPELYNQFIDTDLTQACQTTVECRQQIDRDFAVRWVKRYVAWGMREKALRVTAKIRKSTDLAFNQSNLSVQKDLIFQSNLYLVVSEIYLYKNKPKKTIRYLDRSKNLLIDQKEQYRKQWNDHERWWVARILGRIFNNWGYYYWSIGQYYLASKYFEWAINILSDGKVYDELIDSLKNQGFVLGHHLGKLRSAHNQLDQAKQFIQEYNIVIDTNFELALIQNTRGSLYIIGDDPKQAVEVCQQALDTCVKLGEERGEGLCLIMLGLAHRKLGNLRRRQQLSKESFAQSEEDFQKAKLFLGRAVVIFSKKENYEPLRVWEAKMN